MRDRTRMINLIQEVDQLGQPQPKKKRKQTVLSEEKINSLVEMLYSSEIMQNPYSMKYLQKQYAKIPEEEKNLFTVENLFEEGYLLHDLEEWRFNIEFKNSYAELEEPEDEKEKQILHFLIRLSAVPYEDQLRIKVVCPVTDMADFVMEDDGETIISLYGKGWEKYGSVVLGIWWDQIQEEEDGRERTAQTKKWFTIWNRLQAYCCPELYMEQTQELYECCLERLEKEYERTDSRQTRRVYERNIWLRNRGETWEQVKEWFADYPMHLLQQLEYTERRMSEAIGTTVFYRNLSQVLNLCMRNIADMDEQQSRRFYNVLTVPYPYETYMGMENCPEMLALGMEQWQVFPVCAGTLIEKITHLQRIVPDQIPGILKQVCEDLFAVLQQHVAEKNTAWTESIVSFQWYLNRESRYGFRQSIGGDNTKIPQMVRDAYGQWYEEQVCQKHMPLQEELLKRCEDAFMQLRGVEATRIFLECVWLMEMEHTPEAVEKTLQLYVTYLQRVSKEDMLISQMDWTFWQKKIWKSVMELVAVSPKDREQFVQAFSISVYRESMEKDRSGTVLTMGKAGMIHLYLFTVLFLEEQNEMGETAGKQMEKAFLSIIYAFLEDDKLFHPSYVNSMDTGNVVQRIVSCIEKMTESARAGVMHKLETVNAAVVLLFLEYSRNREMRAKLMEILQSHMDEEFSRKTILTSTWQQMVQQLLIVAEKEENTTLAKKAEQLTDKLETVLKSRGKEVFQRNQSWFHGIRAQIAIALNDKETLQKMENGEEGAFYQGYLKLNSEKLEDIKEAEKIYGACLKEHDNGISYYINGMASCVRIATHEEAQEEEKIVYSARARKLEKEMQQRFPEMSAAQKQIIWENKLYLSLKEQDISTFWTDVKEMPAELWDEISCVKYIVEMYWNMGQEKKAQDLLQKMKKQYGDSEEIKELELKIIKMTMLKSDGLFPVEAIKRSTMDREDPIQQLQDMLPKVKVLQTYDSARVYLHRSDLENPVETYLMVMLLRVLQVMEENVGLLIRENKTAEENTYSKLIQILFNRAMSEVFGFTMVDQSQGGTTGIIKKNGEDGVGSMDLCICKDDRKQAIIEGIKVCRYDKKDLKKHVLKILGYNYANAPVVVHLILAECAELKELWNSYVRDLDEYWADAKGWEVLEVVRGEDTELVKKQLLDPVPHFLLLTKHRCRHTGRSIQMYHVMIDIKKENEKELAKIARKK